MISNILDDIVIIVDTREKKNGHIIEYLESKNIPYIVEKLDTGDYSYILPNYPELKLDRSILIEKKNSLDEIAGNFTKERERFKREFERVGDAKIHLVIENTTWKKVVHGSYRSQFSPQAMIASLLTWNIRYNCPIWFVGKDETGELIYNILHYELLEQLKGLRNNEGVAQTINI